MAIIQFLSGSWYNERMNTSRFSILDLPLGSRDALLKVGQTRTFNFTVSDSAIAKSRRLRFVGEADVFTRWRQESGIPYYIFRSIEDALSTVDTYDEKFALAVSGRGESFERNAFMKLKSGFFPVGNDCIFTTAVKVENLEIADGGYAVSELAIYRARDGRHPDDTFDAPDMVVSLNVEEGSSDWKLLSTTFDMPEDAVAVLVRIGLYKATGTVRFGSPRLCKNGTDNLIPPFDHDNQWRTQYNWLGENLSRRDWPCFEIAVDGQEVFKGETYTGIVRGQDFEVDLPKLDAGEHALSVTLVADYESAIPFLLQTIELVEDDARSFEVVAYPDIVKAGREIPVLIRRPVEPKEGYEECGLGTRMPYKYEVIKLPPEAEGGARRLTLSLDGRDETLEIRAVVANEDDGVRLSTGDIVYLRQSPRSYQDFIAWYLANRIGNAICFRPAYRWSGSRIADPEAWRAAREILDEYGIEYSLMVDGRELPGKNANPPDSWLKGANYRGRQAHENDGSFYYWNNHLEYLFMPDPYTDIFAKSADRGGIHPAVRPIRRGKDTWSFFDPEDASNVKESATRFVNNLKGAKADSTRHTGPSTLFRYFFQAGYDFCGAEQMYGPEEVILSALRGASRAYGKKLYGTHLATQWSSDPHDEPEHAERYYLSLALSYMHGASDINVEEGLWRMEKGYVAEDRFSYACKIHRDAHERFRLFQETHSRKGELVSPVAFVQGRYDGWSCFSRDNLWCRPGEQWRMGDAERSYDMLKVFYPRSEFGDIYRCPCPKAPQGWYTGTPSGIADLIPSEMDAKLLFGYKIIAMTGWHSYENGDGAKWLEYVRQGGTFLLTRAHISESLDRLSAPIISQDSVLKDLLGDDYATSTGLVHRKIGAGEVYYFATDNFPGSDSVREAYSETLRTLAKSVEDTMRIRGWFRANNDIGFTVYDKPDGKRTIYLLNIRWWDRASSLGTLLIGNEERQVEVPYGEIKVIDI